MIKKINLLKRSANVVFHYSHIFFSKKETRMEIKNIKIDITM